MDEIVNRLSTTLIRNATKIITGRIDGADLLIANSRAGEEAKLALTEYLKECMGPEEDTAAAVMQGRSFVELETRNQFRRQILTKWNDGPKKEVTEIEHVRKEIRATIDKWNGGKNE